VTSGGFGPVGINADAGDTLEVLLLDAGNHEIARLLAPVPIARRPVVVRTTPPRGKTDVPLNIRIEVVFSEPIDPASLPGAVRLMNGSTPMTGRVEPGDLGSLTAAFVPSTPLSERATYTLEITRGIRDVDGETLEEAVTVSFTTEVTSPAPPGPSLRLLPDTLRVASWDHVSGWLVAVVRDAQGQEVVDLPVQWSSSDPEVLSVAPALPSSLTERQTAYLTGFGTGMVDVVAASGLGSDTMTVIIEPARFTDVSVLFNARFRCYVGDDARIYCDGDNQFGQFGIGIADHAPQPVVAVASAERFATVSSGIWHSCALTFGGAAYCWGHNGSGQVGKPPSRAEPTPVLVSSDLSFTQLSVAAYHSCGLDPTGAVHCWGAQWSALSLELNEPGPISSSPVRVPGDIVFREVSARGGNTCGIDVDGIAYCWGLNSWGQLGNGTFEHSTTPVRVAGDLRFISISAGGQVCGVSTEGSVYCWGGLYVDGDYAATTIPVKMPMPADISFTEVHVGGRTTCALAADGSAYCWGLTSNLSEPDTVVPPTQVPGNLRFVSLSAGYDVCGVTADSLVYCWTPFTGTPAAAPGQR
jgi:hypothetical protein